MIFFFFNVHIDLDFQSYKLGKLFLVTNLKDLSSLMQPLTVHNIATECALSAFYLHFMSKPPGIQLLSVKTNHQLILSLKNIYFFYIFSSYENLKEAHSWLSPEYNFSFDTSSFKDFDALSLLSLKYKTFYTPGIIRLK